MVGGCRSLVAEHWWLKPEPLGSIPSGTTFLSFPLPFQGIWTVTAQIIFIGHRTWVSPIYQAPYAVMNSDSFEIVKVDLVYQGNELDA